MHLINKYVWLVETIHRAKRISFYELQSRWLDSELSEGIELSQRTFHKWRIAVESLFGLCIDCQRAGGYNYYIANSEVLEEGNIRGWFFRTVALKQLLYRNISLSDRILLEENPSSLLYLEDIIRAMKSGQCIQLRYQGYTKTSSHDIAVAPYAVKVFKQRWYLLAKPIEQDQLRIYALDRIQELAPLITKFQICQGFDAQAFFRNNYGVILDERTEAERIELRITALQACYLKSLPLHHSQRLLREDSEYSVFELYLSPTHDFVQTLLSYGGHLEVLAPESLRGLMKREVSNMMNLYQ